MKKTERIWPPSLALALLALLAAGAGCKSEGSGATGRKAGSAREEPSGGSGAVLDAYERVRAHLAKDEVAGAVKAAAALREAATQASTDAPADSRAHLDALARAASDLASTSPEDPDAVREAFGEASRPFVAMLAADSALAGEHHVFECPMAQGYKKWVQPDAELSNPYMGTRMPKCGTESEWEP